MRFSAASVKPIFITLCGPRPYSQREKNEIAVFNPDKDENQVQNWHGDVVCVGCIDKSTHRCDK
jgi:hypothetical protein